MTSKKRTVASILPPKRVVSEFVLVYGRSSMNTCSKSSHSAASVCIFTETELVFRCFSLLNRCLGKKFMVLARASQACILHSVPYKVQEKENIHGYEQKSLPKVSSKDANSSDTLTLILTCPRRLMKIN